MNHSLCLLALFGILCSAAVTRGQAVSTTQPALREKLSLDRGWLFHLGDVPMPTITGQGMAYMNAKAGQAWGAAALDFDDSDWRSLDLPHDWAVETPIDQNANLSQGFHTRGIGWYRRYFTLPEADRGRHLELQFDGIATHCTVWVNGVLAHRNWCGYTSSCIDVSPFAKYGDVNCIAIRVDADAQEGWWYEGAGIYRHTWLVKRSPVHIATDGVFANPIRALDQTWSIPVQITLNSSDETSAEVQVETTLFDPSGETITSQSSMAAVAPLQTATVSLELKASNPQLWSIDSPTLYRVLSIVKRDGKIVDQVETHCGFRTLRFDADKGFFLNDQPVKLKGTCNHQDHAGVGVAVPEALWDFRIRRLKEIGSNAYRCAHNPPAAEFLDACDRLGMLVLDENRNFGTTPEHLRQLDWMVRRDRNRPSIILWSVFNEEPFQGSWQGFEMVRRLTAAVKALDTSRPVTAAQSDGMLTPVNASLAADVAGFNYRHGEYDRYHAAHPDKPISSTEDTSAVQTRGEFTTDKARAVIASYDDEYQPWGLTHHQAWKEIDQRPFVAGGFVWTGFDYRGEPQPLEWPATGSSFGIMDSCGFPKTAFYQHQAWWLTDRAVLQIVPHWNWAGKEGQPIRVMVVTNADHVTLLLNQKPLGEKPIDKYEFASWNVPYEPGTLVAIATLAGKEISRFKVETTGPPAALQLSADRTTLAGDGDDTTPITIRAVDAQGRVVPTADPLVKLQIDGGGQVIGVGNGDPLCHEPDKASQRSLFHGLAQALVQSRIDSSGAITLRASSDGLSPATLTLNITPAQARPSVPAAQPKVTINRWRRGPISTTRPAGDDVDDKDFNSWSETSAGHLTSFNDGTFALFRAKFRLRAATQSKGATVRLHGVVGKGQIWLDGKPVAEKNSDARADMTVPVPAGSQEHTLTLLIEAARGTHAGLGGTVTFE